MNFQKQTLRPLFFLFLLMCLLSGLVGVVREPVNAAPQLIYPANSVVISEFRFRGPSGGNDEFIELYNPTGASIDISGWFIRGSNNAGVTALKATIPALTTLLAGQYYLITNNNAAGPYSGSVLGNLTYGAGITDDGGVAIILPDGITIVDQVGLSVGSAYKEGTVPSVFWTTNLNQSYERRIGSANGSCQDDANNLTDFTLISPSDPQNLSTPIVPCGVPTVTPSPTPPNVVINEIAWAGTIASSDDEWIELYNSGGTAVDISGWRLVSASGSLDISFPAGTIINAGTYFLIERRELATNVPANLITAYPWALNDSGEILRLRQLNGTIVDTANSNGGAWPTVSGSPNFPSMERTIIAPDSDFVWVTFSGTPTVLDAGGNGVFGTPGTANLQSGVTPTFTPSSTPTITSTSSPTATATKTSTPTPSRTSTPGVCGVGTTPTSIIINEIAWAGTANSATDEWIELYNPTALLINLNGWILKAVDNTPNIPLTNINLAPGQYYLLERTDDTTVSDATANQIFTGEVGNTNEILQLYNSSGVCVDTANSNSGIWPAGTSSSPFGTMERRGVVTDSDTAWITNVNSASWLKHDARGTSSTNYLIHGTPGYGNWAFSVTSTPSPIPSNTSAPTKFKTSTPAPTALPPPPPLIAISEFVPRPAHDWNQDGVIDVGDEYIEIINHGVIDVNLSGYSLDDEANIGSVPYRLPAVTLKPGERRVFYGKETGLLLSDGGDGVRLLKPNGQLGDAYNYTVVRYPDQAYCRLPDDGGLDPWSQNCFPTPGLKNSLSGSFVKPPIAVDDEEPLCPISDTLPIDFAWAECPSFGNMWSRFYWDAKGWFGEKSIPDLNSKWDVYVD